MHLNVSYHINSPSYDIPSSPTILFVSVKLFLRKFRIKWPWEQDRQMAVYNRTPDSIQIASDPAAGTFEKFMRLECNLCYADILFS